ncbi:MAG: STAS domain-containing protein [Anaerolineae bacterium]|nr:STAS domain-containing protein [Anaerolineae bacterium]
MVTKYQFSGSKRIQLFELFGRLDGDNACVLAHAAENAIKQGYKLVILDLDGVEYLNSAGLRGLMQVFWMVEQSGGTLYLVNPTERVRTLLELVGLDTVMTILPRHVFDTSGVLSNASLNISRELYYLR